MIRHLPRLLCGSFALVLLGAAPAIGQQQETEVPPAHVSYSDGFVAVEHDATSEQADPNTPLLPGDRIRTELGRAEILFGDGTVVHLDEHTAVDLLSASLLRLMSGRIVVVAGSGLAGQLQIDAPAASVRVLSAGEYRVSLLPRGEGGDLELAVIRGNAELIGDADSLVLRAGQRALASLGMEPTGPWPFNSAQFDAFAQWSRVRLDARLGPGSYQYVPPELRSYAGTFDSYGWWDYQPTYGYVWFPRVDHGWRPYYNGRWKHYRRLGWTWIGGPRWAWPTHHYGRWGITSAAAWFWIPGRHWGAAWVHWGVAPGYVSWCPLGFDDRPVFAFWSRVHRGYDPWRGWTVVRRSHFGNYRHVRRYALDGPRVVSTHGTAFVTQRTAPEFRSVGVSRSGRVAGVGGTSRGVAVPRGSVTAPARRGDRALALSPARRPRSAGVPTAPASASLAPGVTSRAGTQPSRAGTQASRAGTQPPSAGAGRARGGAIGRAVPRASAPSRRVWRPEDVPVHRGIPPAAADPPPAGVEAPADEPVRRPGPSYRSPDTHGDGGAGMAVPRGNGGRRDGGYVPPRTTEGPSRGSVGVPSHRSADPPAPPPSRAGDSGGRERRAPEGSGSGARAVPRGDSGGGSTGGGGGRVGGRSRR